MGITISFVSFLSVRRPSRPWALRSRFVTGFASAVVTRETGSGWRHQPAKRLRFVGVGSYHLRLCLGGPLFGRPLLIPLDQCLLAQQNARQRRQARGIGVLRSWATPTNACRPTTSVGQRRRRRSESSPKVSHNGRDSGNNGSRHSKSISNYSQDSRTSPASAGALSSPRIRPPGISVATTP
jgi:hypothetical protein